MPIEKWSDEVVLVHLADEPQFSEDLQALGDVVRKDVSVVLNFSAVRYINSSNISQLLKLRKQLISTEARLLLCGLTNQVWGVFLLTGLDKIFEFSDSVSTALATFQIDLQG